MSLTHLHKLQEIEYYLKLSSTQLDHLIWQWIHKEQTQLIKKMVMI